MRKTITLLLVLITLGTSAQKKDSAKVKYDTAFVFSVKEIDGLKTIIMNSRIIGENGQQLTGTELNNLLIWLSSHATLFKKEQPK